jgi:sporulation protein YqfC
MSFFDEIKKFFYGNELVMPFRATLLGSNALYFEGVKAVKSFSKERIELLLKKGEIIIEGEELCIKKYFAFDLAITGKIKSVSIK